MHHLSCHTALAFCQLEWVARQTLSLLLHRLAAAAQIECLVTDATCCCKLVAH